MSCRRDQRHTECCSTKFFFVFRPPPDRDACPSAPICPTRSVALSSAISPPSQLLRNEKIWLVSFMSYDLGFCDHETCRIEGAVNPFAPKVSSMFPVRTVIELSRLEITS